MHLAIRDMNVSVSLGVYPWERERQRSVRFSLDVEYDGARAAFSDELKDTLDYVEVEQTVLSAAQSKHYDLLERLVKAVGEALLQLERVSRVTVEVTKPGALAHAAAVSIRETYER